MSNEKIEFTRGALEHAEKRIELMDQKASILMAIQAGFYVFIVTVIKDFLGGISGITKLSKWVGIGTYAFLIISLFFTFIVIFYLLRTIRPRKSVLKNKAPVRSTPASNYIYWFDKNVSNTNQLEYNKRFDALTEEDMIENLKRAHLASLQLVELKYIFYRKAMKWMDYLILWNMIGVFILMGISLYKQF
ncbi:hypothetical protein LCL95_10110 [Bacillus timonensis]|nr:hypothetical protein [Bacillus timonensis]